MCFCKRISQGGGLGVSPSDFHINRLCQQMGDINHHLLRGLKSLWLNFSNEIPRELEKTQRDDERDEKKSNAGESHNRSFKL
jgi:hypothetical protein